MALFSSLFSHPFMLFLFQAIVLLFDKEDARVGKKMVKLFKAFSLSNIVKPDQFISVGFSTLIYTY